MPRLNYRQTQILEGFRYLLITKHAEILRQGEEYNKDPQNQPNIQQYWEDVKNVLLGSEEALTRCQASNLGNFIAYLEKTNTDGADFLRIINRPINASFFQADDLVIPSKHQAASIELLFNKKYIKFTAIAVGNHPLPRCSDSLFSSETYLRFSEELFENATGEKETDWLNKFNHILYKLHRWIDSNPNLPGYSHFKADLHALLVNLQLEAAVYYSEAGFFSRLGALLLGPFVAIAAILLNNPLRNTLYGLATRDKSEIKEILTYPFRALVGLIFMPIFGAATGLEGYFQFIKTQWYLTWDRYSLISLAIIGAAIASALAVVFFPPVAPFILGLPYLGFLASLSMPLLATVTGVTVGVLLTALTSMITLFATVPEVAHFNIEAKEPAIKDTKDTEPLLTFAKSPEAQAALCVKSAKLFDHLPAEVEVKYQLIAASAESRQGEVCLKKAKPCNLQLLRMEFNDKQLSITPLATGLTGEIRLGIYPEPVVFKNGQCQTKLPPYIKFNAYQPAQQPQNTLGNAPILSLS